MHLYACGVHTPKNMDISAALTLTTIMARMLYELELSGFIEDGLPSLCLIRNWESLAISYSIDSSIDSTMDI